jgi:hypothetical protein
MSASRDDKNASASAIPGATWPVSVVATDGMPTGSVTSYWAGSDARSAGRAGACGGVGAKNSFTELTRWFAT